MPRFTYTTALSPSIANRTKLGRRTRTLTPRREPGAPTQSPAAAAFAAASTPGVAFSTFDSSGDSTGGKRSCMNRRAIWSAAPSMGRYCRARMQSCWAMRPTRARSSPCDGTAPADALAPPLPPAACPSAAPSASGSEFMTPNTSIASRGSDWRNATSSRAAMSSARGSASSRKSLLRGHHDSVQHTTPADTSKAALAGGAPHSVRHPRTSSGGVRLTESRGTSGVSRPCTPLGGSSPLESTTGHPA